MRALAVVVAGLIGLVLAHTALAHDGVSHSPPEDAVRHSARAPVIAPNTLGFPDVVGGDYRLMDQFGNPRTSKDPGGHYQLIFFGYASCKAICSVALPRMTQAADILASKGVQVTPLMITVDPERDTPHSMRETVPAIHPRLIGLTGSADELASAYRAFNVEKTLVHVHPDEGPIYAHGSFVYLTGPDGAFKTLMPPVLSLERMAEIVISYAAQSY